MTRPQVTVPDIVGMDFLVARQIAGDAGVSLANPNADGPPIGALAWPDPHTVVRQDPAPGTLVAQWESLRVWLSPDPTEGDGDGESIHRSPLPEPPSLRAYAQPDRSEGQESSRTNTETRTDPGPAKDEGNYVPT